MGGGFSLTYPVKPGDEALVVFSSRWGGEAVSPPDSRMRDLSDGLAIVGSRSQAGKLDPAVGPENVQLRMDAGKASLPIKPDKTVDMRNDHGSVVISPAGEITLEASASVTIKAPQVTIEGNLTATGAGGGAGVVSMRGAVTLEGTLDSSGDMAAEGKSMAHHAHHGDSGGTTLQPL